LRRGLLALDHRADHERHRHCRKTAYLTFVDFGKGKKRDRLPACEHLSRWVERNAQYGSQLELELGQRGVVAELTASNRVTEWAYAQTEAASGLTWVQAEEMVPLAVGWQGLIRT
jgi:hypothetical protein